MGGVFRLEGYEHSSSCSSVIILLFCCLSASSGDFSLLVCFYDCMATIFINTRGIRARTIINIELLGWGLRGLKELKTPPPAPFPTLEHISPIFCKNFSLCPCVFRMFAVRADTKRKKLLRCLIGISHCALMLKPNL